ncbi:MAG: VWA domain-containing protein [Nanoarchaeota archaeon]|nr:VWA domain-containing protein [Nanoarchaeota archaeon]
MKFANFQTLKRIDGKNVLTKNYTILFIRVGTLLCVILAVAESTFWYEGLSNNNDFVIAIDTSASMAAQDMNPSRLDSAKSAAKRFIEMLDSESKIGIVTFSGVSFIEAIPTKNREYILSKIDEIEIEKAGGTDIPGAIITGANLMLNSEKGKTMLIFTDGSNTVGRFLEDAIMESTDYANKYHVIVHTIGIGSETEPIGYLPTYYNVSSVYNENNLVEISNSTRGFYFQAEDNEKLVTAYEEIANDSKRANLSIDITMGLMIAAIILLFLEWALISTRFRSIP